MRSYRANGSLDLKARRRGVYRRLQDGQTKTQEDADDSLQLSVYALAAQRLGLKPGA